MDYIKGEILWTEKFRPQTIEDCILPKHIKDNFLEIVNKGVIQNLLLSGGAGIGKTTVAKALCDQMKCSWILINASEDNGIDTVRTTIRNFASRGSLTGGRKVVILDEADYINKNSAQPALRSLIEEFSKSCSFIFTCNYPNRLMEAILSRLSEIKFSIPPEEKNSLMFDFMTRTGKILDFENVTYDQNVLGKLILRHYPDNRKVLNELQNYASSGTIDIGVLSQLKDIEYTKLIEIMKEKRFSELNQWVADISTNDLDMFYELTYKNLYDSLTVMGRAEAVMALAEGQKYHSIVASQELHILGVLTLMLGRLEFV